METVRCEELQLELSAAIKSRSAAGRSTSSNASGISTTGSSTVTWAQTTNNSQGSEIDKIMAKIEQARLSIANVCVLDSLVQK